MRLCVCVFVFVCMPVFVCVCACVCACACRILPCAKRRIGTQPGLALASCFARLQTFVTQLQSPHVGEKLGRVLAEVLTVVAQKLIVDAQRAGKLLTSSEVEDFDTKLLDREGPATKRSKRTSKQTRDSCGEEQEDLSEATAAQAHGSMLRFIPETDFHTLMFALTGIAMRGSCGGKKEVEGKREGRRGNARRGNARRGRARRGNARRGGRGSQVLAEQCALCACHATDLDLVFRSPSGCTHCTG